jgi:cytochrome P450
MSSGGRQVAASNEEAIGVANARFLVGDVQACDLDGVLPSFGAGPRACIGSQFAILEAAIAMAVLLQRFRIDSELEDVPLDSEGITLRPKGAVPIRLAPR